MAKRRNNNGPVTNPDGYQPWFRARRARSRIRDRMAKLSRKINRGVNSNRKKRRS